METHLIRLIAAGRVATLCIHGDDPRAVDNARLVRRILEGQGIAVRSFAADPGRPGSGPGAMPGTVRSADIS